MDFFLNSSSWSLSVYDVMSKSKKGLKYETYENTSQKGFKGTFDLETVTCPLLFILK